MGKGKSVMVELVVSLMLYMTSDFYAENAFSL